MRRRVTMATVAAVVSLGQRALGLAARRARLLPGASARALSLRNSRPRGGKREEEEGGRTCSRPDPPQPFWAGPGRPQSLGDSALDHLAGIAPGEAGPSLGGPPAPPVPAFQGRPRAWEGGGHVSARGSPMQTSLGFARSVFVQVVFDLRPFVQ